MSDLHKLFLKRVRQQEQALGLSLLSEEEELPPLPSIKTRPRQDKTDENHYLIFKQYEQIKALTFPIIEKYDNNIQFQTYYKPPSSSKAPIFVFCHGAGSSAMTFCKLTQSIAHGYDDELCGLFAFDMRGHGNSNSVDPIDYGLETLTEDFAFIINHFHQKYNTESSIYLVGHSLGGSVLTNFLQKYPIDKLNIKGLVMLDIVEETAVSALSGMNSFLDRIPSTFPNYSRAIDWHIKATGLLKNHESAIVSVPDLLVDNDSVLKWKTDLRSTKPFWDTWFKGLSSNFVTCAQEHHVAKLLILAGHETLDTSLIIGQMQGKYQLIVFNDPSAGHFLHEDIPDKVSASLIDFAKRNDSPGEYMKKELGFVPKWGGKIHS